MPDANILISIGLLAAADGGILIIIGLFAAMYFLLFRPQQKRERERRALVNSLTEGDEVVTNAGIHGVIVEVEPTIVWMEVAPDVELKIARDAVAARTADSSEDSDDTGESDASEKK